MAHSARKKSARLHQSGDWLWTSLLRCPTCPLPDVYPSGCCLPLLKATALRFCEIISGVPRPCQKWRQFPCCYASAFLCILYFCLFLVFWHFLWHSNRFCMLKFFRGFRFQGRVQKPGSATSWSMAPSCPATHATVSPSNGVPPTFQVHDVVPPKDGRTNPRMNQGTDFLRWTFRSTSFQHIIVKIRLQKNNASATCIIDM